MDDPDSTARSPCPITLHVPTSSLSWGPDVVSDESSNSNAASSSSASSSSSSNKKDGGGAGQNSRRRPHPGGLDTLPEASHVNALASATGPSPMGLGGSNGGVDDIVSAALASMPPPSRSLAVARNNGYAAIAIDLTNERWRQRWTRLCLAPASLSTSSTSLRGESRGLGIAGDAATSNHLPPSSSRGGRLASSAAGAAAPASSSAGGGMGEREYSSTIDEATAREAEEWRRMPCFRRGEVNVTTLDEASEGVLALASQWLELDSPDEGIRLDAEIALRQEVAYAAHMGLSHLVLPGPSSEPASRRYLIDYARAIAGLLTARGNEMAPAGNYMRLSIRLPVSSPHRAAAAAAAASASALASLSSGPAGGGGTASSAQMRAAEDDDWAWQAWDLIRNVARYHARLGVVLDASAPLPPAFALQRWPAEPVRAVWLPAASFLANAKGYPVLSKAAQSLLRSLLATSHRHQQGSRDRMQLVVVGTQHRPPHHTRGGQAAYHQYLRHVERTLPPPTSNEIRAQGYHDYLQAPLQPLLDNLEAQTYATFEADPAKYQLYEQAVFQALVSLPRQSPSLSSSSSTVSVWVVGAGRRGPLVDRCLAAAQRARRTIRVVAVEKNVHACVGLRDRAETEWGTDVVEVRMGDMRTLRPPQHERERADIVVSELLGSFGDNELSPECLDGAMRFLKADGISIPQAYSSYLTPISTPKLHAQVLTGKPLGASANASELRAAETPYVVLLDAFTNLAALPPPPPPSSQQQLQVTPPPREAVQLCWAFEHSQEDRRAKQITQDALPLTNGHNARSCNLTFTIPHEGTCHGLAGYFEAQLFDDVFVSIHPDAGRASEDMLSWFPIFFPFKDPLFCPAGAELDISMWRLTAGGRVWYEWCGEVFLSLPSLSMSSSTSNAAMNNDATTPTTGHVPVSAIGQRAASGASDATTSSVGGSAGAGMARGHSNEGSAVNAFSNAPYTPRLPMSQLPGTNEDGILGGAVAAANTGASGATVGLGLPSVVGGGNGVATGAEMMNRRASNNSSASTHRASMMVPAKRRIKVGMTPLMNPGGRSSFVSM